MFLSLPVVGQPKLSEIFYILILIAFAVKGDGKHDIILSAYMNSGSRFTGKLLGFINQSFYFYEPLWKFTVWDYYTPPNMRCSSTEGSCRYDNYFFNRTYHLVQDLCCHNSVNVMM